MVWSTWLIVAIVLLVLEIVSPTTFFFACLGIGAAFAGLASFVTGNLMAQSLVFAVSAVVSMYFVRPLAKKFFSRARTLSNVDALIGRSAYVEEPVDPLHPGMVKIDGEIWRAESEDAFPKGVLVKVKAVDGTKLIVKKPD